MPNTGKIPKRFEIEITQQVKVVARNKKHAEELAMILCDLRYTSYGELEKEEPSYTASVNRKPVVKNIREIRRD